MYPIRTWFASVAAAFALLAPPAFAQDVPSSPLAKARLFTDTSDKASAWAAVEFTITDGWHIYWQNPGDSGIPTTLRWESLPQGVTAGPIHWPVPERAGMGGLVNYGYAHKVILPVPLSATSPDAFKGTLTVKADWLVCKDTCIPESAILHASLEDRAGKADIKALHATLEHVPVSFPSETFAVVTNDAVRVAVHTEANTHADIFPITDGLFPNSATPSISRTKGWIGFTLPRASADVTDRLQADLELVHEGIATYYHIDAPVSATIPTEVPPTLFAAADTLTSTPSPSIHAPGFWMAVLLAFLGGLILNLMPCVLPVLSLKVLSLSRKAEASHRTAIMQGLSYTAGVLASFAFIGAALLALKAGGMAIGWGFQLQSPGFVLALLIVVFLVALNLLGLFELPVLFGSRGHNLASRNSALGSFATGVLAVALATPCTAPFMAPALGAALTLPAAAAMLIFLTLGLGLALPYLLFSSIPALRAFLPKPGQWMQRFKELLSFPMFATAIWLVWVLSEQTGGAGLLRALAVLLVIALSLWGLKRNHHRLWHAFWAVLLFGSIGCALVNPPTVAAASSASQHQTTFDSAQLSQLRHDGTPVFVDATAAWCITCKVNERVALQDSRIISLFKERSITLMVADWTKRDDAITAWLSSFGRSGVPLYVYYPPGKEPVVLPQILTPNIVESAITH